jgi:hypothetical protein
MVRALPNIPVPISSVTKYSKAAGKDIVLLDEASVPIETMTDLLFEDIGGQEIIGISRYDTVDGINLEYTPIKNLSGILSQYNPQNIIPIPDASDAYFRNFAIRLSSYLVEAPDGTGPNGESVYIDPDTGDLVINFVNLPEEEEIQVQILNSGTIITDIIETS